MEKTRLQQRVVAGGLDRVRMFAPIPRAQVPTLLDHIDIAYIGWLRSPIYRFGIAPNKLLDYMMAGRAVLHSVEAGNDPVAESGSGLTVAPESPIEIAGGLRRLAGMSCEQRREMGERGRKFVIAHHTYPVLARRFLDACS
jgi:glycosyltransferase involved in cell wall biosynthesis